MNKDDPKSGAFVPVTAKFIPGDFTNESTISIIDTLDLREYTAQMPAVAFLLTRKRIETLFFSWGVFEGESGDEKYRVAAVVRWGVFHEIWFESPERVARLRH